MLKRWGLQATEMLLSGKHMQKAIENGGLASETL